MYGVAPPAYEEATERDAWPLVVRHLSRAELVRLSRVNKHLSRIARARLWGDVAQFFHPSSHEVSDIYDSYIRFLKAAAKSPSQTTHLIHTLHLPPFDGNHYDVNRDLLVSALRRMTNLQALVVSRVAKFDHGFLNQKQLVINPGLRLLVARNCENITSNGLEGVFRYLRELRYIDLSYSRGTASLPVIAGIHSYCQKLQILKLRATGMTSLALDRLVDRYYGHASLRYLDIRDNGLDIDQIGYRVDDHLQPRPQPSNDTVPRNIDLGVLSDITQRTEIGPLHRHSWTKSGISHWLLAGNTITPGKNCIDLFKRSNMYVVDIGQQPKTSSFAIIEELAAHNGDRLIYLRADMSNFSTLKVDFDTIPQEDILSEDPPDYEQAVHGLRPSLHQGVLERFRALETLVICNVPIRYSQDSQLDPIKDIIRFFAAMHHRGRSSLNAQPTPSNDSKRGLEAQPPRPHRLRRIVLEMQRAPRAAVNGYDSMRNADAESMWQEARDDYSFFASEKPDEPETIARAAAATAAALKDSAAELARWRAARRNACQRGDFYGFAPDALASEHWPGSVQIVPFAQWPANNRAEPWDHFAEIGSRFS